MSEFHTEHLDQPARVTRAEVEQAVDLAKRITAALKPVAMAVWERYLIDHPNRSSWEKSWVERHGFDGVDWEDLLDSPPTDQSTVMVRTMEDRVGEYVSIAVPLRALWEPEFLPTLQAETRWMRTDAEAREAKKARQTKAAHEANERTRLRELLAKYPEEAALSE